MWQPHKIEPKKKEKHCSGILKRMCEVDRFLARDWSWWGRKRRKGGEEEVGGKRAAARGKSKCWLLRQGRWNASGDQCTTCKACRDEYNETGAHVTYGGLPQVFIVLLHFLLFFFHVRFQVLCEGSHRWDGTFNISVVLFYGFHAAFFFYCVKFRTIAKFQETSCHKCEGKTRKSCKGFARKAGPMVMKSPDLDNRWQQVAWPKQDTENFLFPHVTCNQTWLNPLMDDSKMWQRHKIEK
jgi:hypothetical protein